MLFRSAAVRKPPQKEKLVKNLKYLKQDTGLKIVSINPVDIVGAEVLWVYNVKNRKIGKYVAAADSGTLGIKGSTIIGYDPKQSVAKTIRKPKEQMREFMAAGKVALRKFLDNIRAVEIGLTGRINGDTVLLKAVK